MRRKRGFIAAQPLDLLYVSSVTFAEIRFGIELASDPMHRADLLNWLTHKPRPMFEHRVPPITEDAMFRWRHVVEEGRKTRHIFSQPDPFVAATAAHRGLVVVTRDTGGYRQTQVPLFNPWVDPPP